MIQRKWRGTTLFLSILAVLGATFGLKFYSTGSPPPATISQPVSTDSPASPPSSPAASGPTATTAPSATSAPAPTGVQTIKGDAVQTRFGNVQVQVTFSGKTITKVDVLQIPEESGRDQEISSYSAPILAQEVVQSQSARVDSIGGATYTSDGYLQSVQSAIDKLG
jgi:uncharacterized protein with FMN-binding domain